MIYDEYGNQWRVSGGDPASRLVSRLRRRGYELIVLPFWTLATGDLAYGGVSEPDDTVRAYRLLDCLEVVNDGSS